MLMTIETAHRRAFYIYNHLCHAYSQTFFVLLVELRSLVGVQHLHRDIHPLHSRDHGSLTSLGCSCPE
jgi:hypothetical protein